MPARTPRPTPRVAVVAATPAPTPVPAGRGKLLLNSDPWSTVYINGKKAGTVPLNQEMAAGVYTVKFECGECPEPTERTFTLEVKPDETTKKIIRLE